MPFRKGFRSIGQKPPVAPGPNWSDPITGGLVGAWVMNEGAGTTLNSLTGKYNGTLSGTSGLPTWSVGKFGPALSFDGSSSNKRYVSVGTINLLGGLSVSAWVYITSLAASFNTIAGSEDASGSYLGGFEFDVLSDGTVKFWQGVVTGATNAIWATASGLITTNTWYHLVMTIDTAGNGNIYVNGVNKTATNSTSVTASGTKALAIGRAGGYPTTQYWPGQLDNVLLYNRALSATEVRRLYADPFCFLQAPRRRIITPPNLATGSRKRRLKLWGRQKPPVGPEVNWSNPITFGLKGCWLFNEKRGTTAYDLTKNGNTGTFGASTTWSPLGPGSGPSVKMPGTNSGLPVTVASIALGTVHSGSVWVMGTDGSSGFASGVVLLGGNYGASYVLYNPGTTLNYSTSGGSVSVNFTSVANTWYHFAVTRNGTAVAFYVNGVQQGATQTLGSNTSPSLSGIGGYGTLSGNNCYPLKGPMWQAQLWLRTLSATEILQLYNDPFCCAQPLCSRYEAQIPAPVAGGETITLDKWFILPQRCSPEGVGVVSY